MPDLLTSTDRHTGRELLLLDLSGVTNDKDARAIVDEYVTPLRRSHGGWGFGWPMTFRWRGDGTPDSGTGVRAQPEPPHAKQKAVESLLRHAPHWDLDVTDLVGIPDEKETVDA